MTNERDATLRDIVAAKAIDDEYDFGDTLEARHRDSEERGGCS